MAQLMYLPTLDPTSASKTSKAVARPQGASNQNGKTRIPSISDLSTTLVMLDCISCSTRI
ncbi:hypothetical protein PCASD_18643 [Puccinia coronata f. sp. avenae]|uniref:Uncharacterized protein n=1 Tax=Puccinia coronata f. sp. avenae TaxID=200324 RepID=A0A2N5UF47_9BASI|nr:hypothetical protein PCASD_18643 [Puccinia coronata f. sp. avenae]